MNLTPISAEPYQATQECANWCIEQKVIGYHNLEIQTVMIVAAALMLIIIGEWLREYPKTAPYAHYLFFFAKIALYFFFYVYFFHVKGGF